MNCSNLNEVILPSSLSSLQVGCFEECNNLTDVKSKNRAPFDIDESVFPNLTYMFGKLYVPEEAIDLYKQHKGWSKFANIVKLDIPKHSLNYTIDGEVYKSYQIEEGATITPESAPTKEGYTFSGWSEIPETMPAHDVTVTGTFSINKYKLTYTIDGEEFKTYDIEYGATITPEAEPTKEGYTFSGWSEIPETMPAHDVTVIGSFIKDLEKCAIPTIRIVDGELIFDCDTEGVTFKWSYSFNGGNVESNGKKAILAGTTNCHVTVYATKEGYQDSDSVEADVELNVGILGDTNRDGRVTITDAVGVVNIILNNSGSSAPAMDIEGLEVYPE